MSSAPQIPRSEKQDVRDINGKPEKQKVISISERKKEVGKDHLTNKLNYINFIEGTVFFNFKHHKYDCTVSLPAKPLTCKGESLNACGKNLVEFVIRCRTINFKTYMFQTAKGFFW